jgi:2-methylcitrate dehydratase
VDATMQREKLKARGPADRELVEIAAFVAAHVEASPAALEQARRCFLEAMAEAILASRRPACAKQLGGPPPRWTAGGRGARVIGTHHLIDLEKAAHDTSLLVRWLDVDDGWLTVERGHPADGIGAILPAADLASRAPGTAGVPMREVLAAMIDAHEIQRALGEHEFDRTEVHHLVLTRVAATAVSARLLGASERQILEAVAHVWLDGQGTFVTRPELDAAVRMAQAAGDAASRATRAVLKAMRGEAVPEVARATPRWGLYDVLCQGGKFRLQPHPATYAIEDVVLKLGVSAEYQALSTVECAVALGSAVRARLDAVRRVEVATHEPAIRLLSRGGTLRGATQRRRSLEYVVAAALLRGALTPEAYEDAAAADPRLDALRRRVVLVEDPRLTRRYFDPVRRGLGSALQVTFADGSATARIAVDDPAGHCSRHEETAPVLARVVREVLSSRYAPEQVEAIWACCADARTFGETPVHRFMDLLATTRDRREGAR